MKILQVINLYSPNHGGSAESVYQLSKYLVNDGHKVTIYCSDYKMTKEYYQLGVATWAFPTKLAIANFHITPRMMEYDFREFDVIHLHNLRSFQNIVASHYAIKYNIPYVIQPYGGVLPVFQKKMLKRIYDMCFGNKILHNARKVVAGVGRECVELKQMGVPLSDIVMIPHLYNVEEFANLPAIGQFRKKYNIKEKHILLFLGRIHQIKGLDFLVHSFNLLNSKREDAFLVIAGADNGYQSSIEQLIKKLGLSKRVLFTGMLRGQDKLEVLVDASVLIQTSLYERSPGSPIDAILSNTPIIVTNGTGAGDIISKMDAGYLVNYGDTEELVRLINKVLDEPTEIKEKTQRARQQIIKTLSWAERVKDYEKVYESLIVKN